MRLSKTDHRQLGLGIYHRACVPILQWMMLDVRKQIMDRKIGMAAVG